MAAVIELDSVTVLRPGKALLQNLTWTVDESERWVVLGANGAGKSTLMQIVGAQMYPTTGTATILGDRLGAVEVFDLRTRIGHSGTSIAERIPPGETVVDAIVSAAHAVTGRWREKYDAHDLERAHQIMGELGISTLTHRTFGTLSEGERKRTLIARALMTDPELLLLDEPGAGLDLGAREDLLMSLDVLSTAPGAPVLVMVSHHVEEIPEGFTHVLMLREGQVVAAGPIEETLTALTLGRTFGMRLELEQVGGRYTARRAAFGHRAR
ncbi:ABC transporter ATP-binding protein [Aeromicrobium sp. CTD01-1L150]|uniref:ABC transporter ATP-binding protein n=1 Tax=Aeromicrobium sp. CTD01-1L150 TaxID=3341830 RepID=UPI0035C24AFF